MTHVKSIVKKWRYPYEVVVVDDGSTDDTLVVAGKLLKNLPHQLLTHASNQGKGAALKTGMLAARGKYVLFSDIDFSTPLSELPKLLTALRTHDVAIGVRRDPRSQILEHQPQMREFMGQIFTKLTNFLISPQIQDATCGFKAYRRAVARRLFSQMRTRRWAFDAEILFLAQKYDYSVAQIPVIWANNRATKVRVVRDGLEAFTDLLKIRVYDLLGVYN